MDKAFPSSDWVPSAPWALRRKPRYAMGLEKLITLLSTQTKTILQHPYDPSAWLKRAMTLELLHCPELTAGDAYKAQLLCGTILTKLESTTRIGHPGCGWGFWMEDESAEEESWAARDFYKKRVTKIQDFAQRLIDNTRDINKHVDYSTYIPQLYPWMRAEHRVRSDELVQTASEELMLCSGDSANASHCCELRRAAFGTKVGGQGDNDVLGVFAHRDIRKNEIVLRDPLGIWACNNAGYEWKISSEVREPGSVTDHDLGWIRERAGRYAADVLLNCRILLHGILEGATATHALNDGILEGATAMHPLDDDIAARLTPKYLPGTARSFTVEHDLAVPFDALQRFGIDIFANPNFDTWVLFTLYARIDNNSWSDPDVSAINPLFSLFNHSCAPNVDWVTSTAGVFGLYIQATRPIAKGEQLFVTYNQYDEHLDLDARRARLKRWLGGPCQCSRCVREESERHFEGPRGVAYLDPKTFLSPSYWDSDDKPVLPEDEEKQESP